MCCHQPAVRATAGYPASRALSRPQGQRLLLFHGGGVLRLPHTWLLSQAEGILGQRVFRSMRVSSTEKRRLAQASSSSIPKPYSDFPWKSVLSQGRCPGNEAFAVCGFLPPRDWAQASSSSPQNISQRMMCFRRDFGFYRTALQYCILSKASVASGKKSCGRAGASLALLSRAPYSRPGFTLTGRSKQTQLQPYISVRSLGWHSMHTTISQCRHRLAF